MTKRLDVLHILIPLALILAVILISLVRYRLTMQREVVSAPPTLTPNLVTPTIYEVFSGAPTLSTTLEMPITYITFYYPITDCPPTLCDYREGIQGRHNVLVPLDLAEGRTNDPASNIWLALQGIFDYPKNHMPFASFTITSVIVTEGHAKVALIGEISPYFETFREDYPMMLLLTIFTEPAIQTASVTLNGECIGNLLLGEGGEPCLPDHVYTRAEAEAHKIIHAYPTSTPYTRPHPCILYHWSQPELCPTP